MASQHTTSLRRWFVSLPPIEYALQHVRELLINALKQGPIPRHIAFVMDGNRRWARSHKLETVEGHNMGFEALARILEVCYKSGVKYVTIYAFSIENFKRSRYEVDGLMDMAKTKLVQMSQHGELFDRYGAAVRVLGDRSLVRDDVLEQVDRAVELTQQNTNAVLNVCFPYTGREEITHSIRETVREYSSPPPDARPREKRPFSETHIQRTIRSRQLSTLAEEDSDPAQQSAKEDAVGGTSDAETTSVSEHDLDSSSNLPPPSSQTSHSPSPTLNPTTPISKAKPSILPDPEAITAQTLTKNTYIDAPPPELLVRTSGVNRLSDFMLWQCHENTEVRFLDCLWPEFDLWHFLPVLLQWQWRHKKEKNGNGNGNGGEVKVA
jgi:ditrans,polycis-polyprenyl diphosphate synthase